MSTTVTREEHLAWCKQRALQYVDVGDLPGAFASMVSDTGKHPDTTGHAGNELGTMLLFGGFLDTPVKMREHLEGYR